jgi:hypothetical protein
MASERSSAAETWRVPALVEYPKVRDITLGILEECGIIAPPVDLGRVVAHFGARVEESDNIAESAVLRMKHGWTIRVNGSLRPERKDFRIAHELGHIYWIDPAHHLGDPNLGGMLEKYCSKFASLLLCPHQWFVQDAPEADFDLLKLKTIYSSVSYEVLTIRLSYLTRVVVTILDNGKLYRRFATPGLVFPAREQILEREVYEAVDLFGAFREQTGRIKWDGFQRKVKVRGYPVFSEGFRRIILLTFPRDSNIETGSELEEDMPYPFPEY